MNKRNIVFYIIFLFGVLLMANPEPNKLDLNQCHELAMENNHELKAAMELVKAAESEKKAAFSNFLPSINFVGGYTLVSKKIVFDIPDIDDLPVYGQDANGNSVQIGTVPISQMGFPDKLEIGQKNNMLFNLSFTQPIFTGGKITENYKIRKDLKNISTSQLKLTKSELIYKIDKYFWQIVSLNEKIKLTQEYSKMIDSHIVDIKNYINEGILTKNYLLKAKIKKREVELNSLKAENGLKLTKMALNQLMGKNVNEEFTTAYELNNIDQEQFVIKKDSLLRNAQINRAEIELFSNMKKVANSLKNIEKSRFFPNIALNGGYSLMNPNPYNSMDDEFGGDYNISLVCNFEIFHFFERSNKFDATKRRLKATSENLKKTKELIELDVNKNIYNISEAVKRFKKAKEMVVESEENLKITQNNFKEGIVNSSEVLDAQTLWQKSFSEKIDASIEYKLSLVELKKATGELGKL